MAKAKFDSEVRRLNAAIDIENQNITDTLSAMTAEAAAWTRAQMPNEDCLLDVYASNLVRYMKARAAYMRRLEILNGGK